MKKVKGIYEDNVVKLLEEVHAEDGAEVEVLFADEETSEFLTQEQRAILERTKGMWADDPKIEEAFKILEEGWREWQLEEF